MLILYPNYSLEIVGNYLAFPFQVVLLVSFKSNLFWLKFLHYEVFNVLAFFKACPLLASFYIVSRIRDFVKNFFQLFEALFLSISMRAIASFLLFSFLQVSLTAWLSYQRYALLSTLFSIFFWLFSYPLLYLRSHACFSCFLILQDALFGLKRPNVKYKTNPVKLNMLKNKYTPFAPKWSSSIPPKNWQQMVLRLLPMM